MKTSKSQKRRKANGAGETFADYVPIRGSSSARRWEGSVSPRPHDYEVTAAIPVLDTPEAIAMVIELLRRQTVRPFIVVIDTGSTPENFVKIEQLADADDVEVHRLRFKGVKHPSDFPAIAMDLAMARCQTDYLFCTHADCFLRRQDVIEEFIALSIDRHSPAVGYQISERPHPGWQGMISHTCTLLDMRSMLKLGVTWNQWRFCLRHDIDDHSPDPGRPNWPDTELMLNQSLRDVGIQPYLVDLAAPVEINREQNLDHRMDHVRSYTSAKIHDSNHLQKMSPVMVEALQNANNLLQQWGPAKQLNPPTNDSSHTRKPRPPLPRRSDRAQPGSDREGHYTSSDAGQSSSEKQDRSFSASSDTRASSGASLQGQGGSRSEHGLAKRRIVEAKEVNTGVGVLSEATPGRPFLITGGGRSGTTAVMRAVSAAFPKLAHFYPDLTTNAEDELTNAYRYSPKEQLPSIIADRLVEYGGEWVSKVPGALMVKPAAELTRTTFNLIVCTRDTTAVACREMIACDLAFDRSMSARLDATRTVHHVATEASKVTGVIYVSFEKLLTAPGRVLHQIGHWLGAEPDAAAGTREVQPEDPRYFA